MKPVHYSRELEAKVLGHLMQIGRHEDLKTQKAMLRLTLSVFYVQLNAAIFGLIKEAFQAKKPFDFVEVMVMIGQGNQALYEHMTWLTDYYLEMAYSTSSLEYELDRLLSLELARKKLSMMESAVNEAYANTDPVDVVSLLSSKASEVAGMECKESLKRFTLAELYDDFLSGKAEEVSIVPTRSSQFNLLLGGGVRAKSLITVAGAAGVGKTGFAIWLLDIIAKSQPDRHSIFFSLEMEPGEILLRYLSIKGEMQYSKLSHEAQTNAGSAVLGLPLSLYDYRAADIEFILTSSRLLATERPISVIVVDYLTLVNNRGNFERNDLRQADTTTKLARLAHELDCIVVALSQVNRGAANREDQCPMPHDAADSSGSHRSSALWLGIDRPELYNDDPCYHDQFVIKCRKNRYGPNFELLLSFNDGAFIEVDHRHFSKPRKPEKLAGSNLEAALCGYGAYKGRGE